MKLLESELKILNEVCLHKGISRKELAEKCALSQAAITKISKKLIAQDHIIEGERISSGLGRKEVMLYSNPKKFMFLGIDIGGFRIRLAISDNSFTIRFSTELLISEVSMESPKEECLIELIQKFLEEIGYVPSSLSAIGIGVTGIVDANHEIILNIPNADNWDNLSIVEALCAEFHCPIFLDEGGRTMALAEKYLGKAKENDFIIVHSAFGVVSGIVTNNRLLRGANNVGGLLGHITADPNGTRCTCGNYGCLENIVTYPVLQHDFTVRRGRGSIKEAYDQNDKTALDVCINAGQALGIALSNVVNLFNPVSIYLGGPMFDDFPILFEECRRTITLRANRFATLSLKLERSSLNHKQGIYGALVLAKTGLLFPSDL